MTSERNYFIQKLLKWNNNDNHRKMPWKNEKDPYKIWVSEIILQQTRVQQGLKYYENFIAAFPDVHSLANADTEKVYKLWEGLGYYSRCKNLIATAKYISESLDGLFPETYQEILALKGIGPYTASAISSFAYNLPHAVVDGNVFRVLSRFFGIDTPIDSTEGKKFYGQLAQDLLDKKSPGLYNQAIMDFGATLCKPALPMCHICPLQNKCIAFHENRVDELPVNNKIIRIKIRYFNYLIIEFDNKYYIQKRTKKDIWEGLHEFILKETSSFPEGEQFMRKDILIPIIGNIDFEIQDISNIYLQQLTHQKIKAKFYRIKIYQPLDPERYYLLATKETIRELAFPKIIASLLKEESLSLDTGFEDEPREK
jgi:A/G-specific adenine glycosylase